MLGTSVSLIPQIVAFEFPVQGLLPRNAEQKGVCDDLSCSEG